MSGTINFNLRARKGKDSSIIAVVRMFGHTIRYSTKLTINANDWSTKNQRPKKGREHLLYTKLDSHHKEIRELLLTIQPAEFSPERIKEKLSVIFGHTEATTNSLLDFSDSYCEGKRGKLLSVANSLRRFMNGRDLFFNEVNPSFVGRYVDFLKGEGLEASTINSYLSDLSILMRASHRNELHENAFKIGKDDKIQCKGDGQIPITLEPSEIKAIIGLKLTGKMERARDLYIIGLMIGQRHSDFSRIRPEMIKNGFIRLTQKKTGKRVSIPIHITDKWGLSVTLSQLLEKYDWRSPGVSKQMFNRYLKRIAKLCITSRVEVVRFPGGERTVTIEDKADHITSHSARRTFCTLLYKSGLSPSTICNYSGHKSEKMLFNYIGISEQEETAIALLDAERNMRSLDELETPKNVLSIRKTV